MKHRVDSACLSIGIMQLNPPKNDHSGRPQYHCFACGHEWTQRKKARVRPLVCPNCRFPRWLREKGSK